MDVTEVLAAHQAQFKPITVDKLVPLEFDLNLLAGFDSNPIDENRLTSSEKNKYLTELIRDNTQLLINEIFKLPVKSTDMGIVAELPARTTPLPREKALPKEKAMTRWEKFAKIKGIQNTKRERMVWDDDRQEYKARYGYSGGAKDGNEDWLMEVPDNTDPMADQYEKKREEKKARTDKNAKRQKRNQEEAAVAPLVSGQGLMSKSSIPVKEFKQKSKNAVPKKLSKKPIKR
ncbi:ribosome biogenesis regulatory protein-domain-containing protein [Phycomyces blakesleeanus]|uniref:Ribosome biogenesis regulatory protein n=1 Tax=Phycomyces blakesleeanus TaxID=4837 RepID=A0ABR3B8F5_PHYBL